MSERSPRFPSSSLRDVLADIEKIYKEAGRSALDQEALVKILGYTGLNGASRSALAALNAYGVLAKDGAGYRVSEDAIGAIRPIDENDRLKHIRQMALLPPIFSDINTNHKECSETVLATVLVRKGFTDDGARKAAKIWKDNFELARLGESGYDAAKPPAKPETGDFNGNGEDEFEPEKPLKTAKNKNMLAQYSIPIGASEATITFTGERLTTEDFDALADYVAIFKKQFERKQKTEASNPIPHRQPEKPAFPEVPFAAKRKNEVGETMVKIIGQPWWEKGQWICQAEGGILVPVKEIFPNFPNLEKK